jgi:hypothetical protein
MSSFGVLTRRHLLQAAAAGGAEAIMASPPSRPAPPDHDGTVRDRLWIFTCAANSDHPHIGRRSLMTPVEGAFYLGVPNIIVVQSSPTEAPFGRLEPPFAQYTVAMQPLERIVWSIVGSGGFHDARETEEVMELARTTPRLAGIMLDDFFTGPQAAGPARLTLKELGVIRDRLKQIRGNLDILVTLYVDQLGASIGDYLGLVDVVTLWTGDPRKLVDLEQNLRKAEALAPGTRRMLGCYLVDYGRRQGTPVPLMQHQCETGLRWLREGRIDGMIFLGNTIMDLGFDSVAWTRDWIGRVGNIRLGGNR